MSRYGGGFRSSADDLAYGDSPQRWDRDRFEQFGRGGGPPPMPPMGGRGYEEDYHFAERDRPGRRDVQVMDRERSRGPRGFQEHDRFYEDDRRYGGPDRSQYVGGQRRRTDRELFGEEDPRELANMAMVPHRRKSINRDIDIDIDINRGEPQPPPPRPGQLLRRQSSLNTFDRRPTGRYEERERDDYRMPAYTPVPLPIRRADPPPPPRSRYGGPDDDYEQVRYRDAQPEGYRETEIFRERDIHRHRGGAKSHKSSRRSSSSSSFEEVSRHSSPERKIGKKGKTRMPKRLVKKQAIIDLGYPFEEEDDFLVVRRALEKEHIDEVIRISETYKETERKVYRYEEKVDEAPPPPPPEPPAEHYEALRTEWINPPSVAPARSVRAPSPAASMATRRSRSSRRPSSPPRPVYEERIDRLYEERSRLHNQNTALVAPDREQRSDRDIQAEIRALEAEQRALRLEREAEDRRDMALRVRERPEDEFQLVEYRDRRPVYEEVRERSPPRNVVRVEKDRKGRMALVRSTH
ncbi:hypothetical protein MBLNU230_g3234t1 [Neophaeotheca triangularis]